MASNAHNQINRLYVSFGGECHYCGKRCHQKKKETHDKATRDHVVPKSLGGNNSMDNYILACSECNNLRGTNLFFCSCLHCKPLIDKALHNTSELNKMFDILMKANKPKISKRSPEKMNHNNLWFVSQPGGGRLFATFEQAVAFVFDTSVECSDHRKIRYEGLDTTSPVQ